MPSARARTPRGPCPSQPSRPTTGPRPRPNPDRPDRNSRDGGLADVGQAEAPSGTHLLSPGSCRSRLMTRPETPLNHRAPGDHRPVSTQDGYTTGHTGWTRTRGTPTHLPVPPQPTNDSTGCPHDRALLNGLQRLRQFSIPRQERAACRCRPNATDSSFLGFRIYRSP